MDFDIRGTLKVEYLKKVFESVGNQHTADVWQKLGEMIQNNKDSVISFEEFTN